MTGWRRAFECRSDALFSWHCTAVSSSIFSHEEVKSYLTTYCHDDITLIHQVTELESIPVKFDRSLTEACSFRLLLFWLWCRKFVDEKIKVSCCSLFGICRYGSLYICIGVFLAEFYPGGPSWHYLVLYVIWAGETHTCGYTAIRGNIQNISAS